MQYIFSKASLGVIYVEVLLMTLAVNQSCSLICSIIRNGLI